MVPCTEKAWREILKPVEQTGCDGVELNFGCPHGMSERGMGSAVGQVPEYIEEVTGWCKQNTALPVFVKLTPNITDIRYPARAAHRAGAGEDFFSLRPYRAGDDLEVVGLSDFEKRLSGGHHRFAFPKAAEHEAVDGGSK